MSESSMDYEDFEPDWWDKVGAAAELVAEKIDSLIEETFGPGGIPSI